MVLSSKIKTASSFDVAFRLRVARVWRTVRANRVSVLSLLLWLVRKLRPVKSAPRSNLQSPNEILVIRLDAMGDLIMSTPVFAELRLRYPSARITAVIQRRNRGILEKNPNVDLILHPEDTPTTRIERLMGRDYAIYCFYKHALRAVAFDICVQPRLGEDYYSANFLMKLVDAPQSFKYHDSAAYGLQSVISNLMCSSMTSLERPAPQHEVLSNLAIVEAVTGVRATSAPQIVITEEDRAYARQQIASRAAEATILCLSFGAQARRRTWPMERWAGILKAWQGEPYPFVLIPCTRAELEDGRRLQELLPMKSHLIAGANLRQVAACLELCDMFIGPDSGLAHMAAAVGSLPIIVSPHPLDGDPSNAGSPVRMAPYSKKARVIQPRAALAPCRDHCEAIEPHCILQVQPEMVAVAMNTAVRNGAAVWKHDYVLTQLSNVPLAEAEF